MARLPDDTALGPLPGLRAERRTASFDATTIARGTEVAAQSAQAVARDAAAIGDIEYKSAVTVAEANARAASGTAKAVESVGKGLTDLGAGVVDYQQGEERLQLARAKSAFEVGKVELESKIDTSDYKTLPQRYETDIKQLHGDTAATIASPRMRERFELDTAPTVAKAISTYADKAFKLEGDADIAGAEAQGGKLIDLASATDDKATRTRIIDAHNEMVDALATKGHITAVQALHMKQQWAQRYALADGIARADRDPEGVRNDLRAQPGSPDEVVNRILSVEGMGKNARSSAVGAGQFIDSTWLDTVKKHRPDLAAGKSDEEILSMRADRNLGRAMTAAYAEDNAAYLRRRGLETTPGNIYLAHFLGPKGAAAVLEAPPGKPVFDVLKDAVGPKQAALMVESNPTILPGRQAGSIVQWADAKMGGADSGSIYRILRPDQRATLLVHAEQRLWVDDVSDKAAFKARVEDSRTEAMRTGAVANPIPQSEFIRVAGYDLGKTAHAQYQADVQLGRDRLTVANMSPAQQNDLLQSYVPKSGEGFAAGTKRYDILRTAIEGMNKEKADDPAAFAIGRLPAVSAAFQTFTAAQSDPAATPADKQQAARAFADAMLWEQGRVGVAAGDRRLVPQAYVDSVAERLQTPKVVGGPLAVAQQIEQEANLWGEHWPLVYRDVAKKAGPVVRVIGSGVTPAAARVLTELAQVPLADIFKDQKEERAKQVKADVLDAFKPFAGSLVGSEDGLGLFNDFRGQAEKLAAYYVVRGKTSGDAAKQAFDELLGHKYEFVSNMAGGGVFSGGPAYRVPKNLAQKPQEIALGAEVARSKLAEMDLAAPADTFGGVSEVTRKTARVNALARDGVWITAPGDSGLALVYNDAVVRRADGQPLVLSWEQLGKLAKDPGAGRVLGEATRGPEGQLESGNIDLDKRPVVKNADGSISTVRSMSIGIDGGKHVLIPTVSDEGTILEPDAAVDVFRKTGRHLGVFDTPENATAYAKDLSAAQAKQYGARR